MMEDTDAWLAELGDAPLLTDDEVREVFEKDPQHGVVTELEAVPHEELGKGKATLHRFPARVNDGRRNRATWVVQVRYPDERTHRDTACRATEAEARDWHSDRLTEDSP